MEGEVCRDTGRERSFTIPRDDKYLRWKTRAWVGGEHPSGLRANDGPLRRLHWRGGREEGTRAPQTTTANYRNEAHPMLHLFLLNKAGGGVEGWKVRTRSPLRSINAFPSSFSFVSSWIRQIFFSLRNKGIKGSILSIIIACCVWKRWILTWMIFAEYSRWLSERIRKRRRKGKSRGNGEDRRDF